MSKGSVVAIIAFSTTTQHEPAAPFGPFSKQREGKLHWGGKRKCCKAAVQDMASGVSKRSYLEGSLCRPARLVAEFSVWVLPTKLSAAVCAEFSQGEGRKGQQE